MCAIAAWGQEKADPVTERLGLIEKAEQGNANAQVAAGLMYKFGFFGLPEDYAEVVEWLRRAAAPDSAEGQSNLDVTHYKDGGVRRDYAEAIKWFRRAAEQGCAGGQFHLGRMYAEGLGVPQDYVRAHMWLSLGALHFSDAGQKQSAEMRDEIAAKMTPAQIAEAQRLAREWKPKPAVQPAGSK
jgi:uncharacterized protein